MGAGSKKGDIWSEKSFSDLLFKEYRMLLNANIYLVPAGLKIVAFSSQINGGKYPSPQNAFSEKFSVVVSFIFVIKNSKSQIK